MDLISKINKKKKVFYIIKYSKDETRITVEGIVGLKY